MISREKIQQSILKSFSSPMQLEQPRQAEPNTINQAKIAIHSSPSDIAQNSARRQWSRCFSRQQQLVPVKYDPKDAEPHESVGDQEQNDKSPSQRVHYQSLETPIASMVGPANQTNPTPGHPTISVHRQFRGVAAVTSALAPGVLR
ncbi:MAG: hypothetical protein JNK57_15445 [Planctomycetaceae bacterium]|nr:hypothetical protein [Planctomycetaceae bacterium]